MTNEAVAYLERWYDNLNPAQWNHFSSLNREADYNNVLGDTYPRAMFEAFDTVYDDCLENNSTHGLCLRGESSMYYSRPLTEEETDLFVKHGGWILRALESNPVELLKAEIAANRG